MRSKDKEEDMKRFKKVVIFLIMAVMCLSIFSGCGEKGSEAAGDDLSKHVELTYYMYGSGGNISNSPSVFQEVNKIVKEKINATINFKVYSYVDYGSKLQLAMNSGENFDMCFIAPWINPMNYQAAVSNKYLMDITDMLPKYTGDIYKSMPEEIWNAARINGKIYGVINEQCFARAGGLMIETDLLEKAGLKASDITEFSDVTAVLDVIKADENISPDGKIPPTTFSYGNAWQDMYMQAYGFDDLCGGALIPGVVKMTDKSAVVINQFETEEYESYAKFMRQVIDDGYVDADDIKNNRIVTTNQRVRVVGTYKPGGEVSMKSEVGGRRDFTQICLGTPMLTTSSVTATMFAINSRSKNPERALMFQNLLYTDRELYNMLCLGIEGRDWKWTDEEKSSIEYIENSQYMYGADWALGAEINAYIKDGQPADLAQQVKELNRTSPKSVAYGFSFDPKNVSTQIVSCNMVAMKYNTAFEQGLYTMEEIPGKIQEMLAELKEAGADKIIAEKQSQLNAFLGK